MPDLATILPRLIDELRPDETWGAVADYIPELALVKREQLAIAVATADGGLYSAGDAEVPFSVQSVTKVFTLAIALGRAGDQLWQRVGREPSGKSQYHNGRRPSTSFFNRHQCDGSGYQSANRIYPRGYYGVQYEYHKYGKQ